MNERGLLALCLTFWSGLFCGCEAPHQEKAASEPPLKAPASTAAALDAGSLPKSVRGPQRAAHSAPRVKAASQGLLGFRAGDALGERSIVLARGQDLVLDFSAGARVHLHGPCVAESAVTELDALLVQRCALSIDLTPAAPTPDSGFSLTTPSATLSLVRGGRLALRVFESGATAALIVSGSVSALSAASAEGQKLLAAGERVDLALDGRVTRAALDVTTLEQAEQRALSLRETKPDKRLPAALDQLLAAQSSEVRGELERERALVIAHRAALKDAATGDEPMALQAQLSSQAAVLARARRRLVAALGQRDASRLSAEVEARGSAREQNKVAEDALSDEARGLLRPPP